MHCDVKEGAEEGVWEGTAAIKDVGARKGGIEEEGT